MKFHEGVSIQFPIFFVLILLLLEGNAEPRPGLPHIKINMNFAAEPYARIKNNCVDNSDESDVSKSLEPSGPSGYYWRDFDPNNIPQDAIMGGTDSENRIFYIGQTLVENKTVLNVALLYANQAEFLYPFHGLRRDNNVKHVKILCASESNVEWIEISDYNNLMTVLEELKENNMVPVTGGYETDTGLEIAENLVGRKLDGDNGHVLGKLIVYTDDQDRSNAKLYYVGSGSDEERGADTNYQLLAIKS